MRLTSVLGVALFALACGGHERHATTAADVLATKNLRPTPDVAVFVDGVRCRNDTLDRVYLAGVRNVEILRDTAAMFEVGPEFRLVVHIATAAAPRVARRTSRDSAVPPAASCQAGALTDANYHAAIPILDAPNGRTRFEIRNDSGSDDVWMIGLGEQADGFFHASLSTLSDTAGREGWIAERYVGIFARNYSRPMTLHAAPDTSAPAQSVVDDWWPSLYPVTGCRGHWLRVRATIEGKIKEGWMRPTMQCDNPYTTCN